MMTNVTLPTYGYNNFMETDMNRNWHLGTNKNFYIPPVDHNLYNSCDGQSDLHAKHDHWSSYSYPLHTYSYHGYGQYDTVDVIPKSSFIVPPQQIYSSSWHVPYSEPSSGYNSGQHSQVYYPTAFKEPTNSHISTRSVSENSGSPTYCINFMNNQVSEPHYMNHADEEHYNQLRNVSDANSKSHSVIHKNPAYGENRVDIYDHKSTSSQLYPLRNSPSPARPIIKQIKSPASPSCEYHHGNSSAKCSKTSSVNNSVQLSSHVKKQEKKMKKILQDLLKTNPTKSSQLLDYYRYHFSLIEQKASSEVKSGYYNIVSPSQSELDFQVLQLIQHVHQQLGILGLQHGDVTSINRKTSLTAEIRKTRLLPKRSVKILDTWFEDNLSNPYPSRDQTLHLAMDCELSVEQIRKWFANKRNRSRNNKLFK